MITLTDKGAEKVREFLDGQSAVAQTSGLRVGVRGGGCSGFQYGFTFDEAQAEDDLALEREGVTLLVDPLSLQYLTGAEIDYAENLSGSQFVIRNPNAKTTCGCGSSFSA